jgi:heptosyltransferase-2
MQKILVIQTAFIGDAVLATAIVEKLHAFYPDAKIDFLVRKGNEALFRDHPFLNEVLVWVKTENKFRNLLKILSRIRKKKYDVVVNVQRFAATGFLTAFSAAKMKIGFDKNPLSFLFTKRIKHIISSGSQPLHEIDRNQMLIEELTDAVPSQPRLYPSEKDFAKVSDLKKNAYIVIAPASVWFTKQYPPDKWAAFINHVPSSINVYLVGAPADKQLCEQIRSQSIHPAVYNLCGQFNFLESAALQKDALMNYVNDSAPMHFASAVNAPVCAVYCSTLPSFGFGPLSNKSFIVETREKLDCRPCGLHGQKACPKGHFKCAYGIKEDQLLDTIGASSN